MVQEAMPLDVPLPNDPVVLQHMIRELLATLKDRTRELDGVQHRLDQLLRHMFGQRSERINPAQPSLFDGLFPSSEDANSQASEAGAEEAETSEAAPRPKKKGHGRKPLPKNLKRERKVHELSETEKQCPCCQKPRVVIGEETSEQLDYEPASLFVWEHVRLTYACVDCLAKVIAEPTAEPLVARPALGEPLPVGSTLESWLPADIGRAPGAMLIRTAPMPAQPIGKGLPGPGLLAYVITSKYVDHLPLYRLESIFGRQGVELSRSTMSDWMAAAAALFKPLVELMTQRVLQSKVIHNDDTPVPVQDPGTGKTKTGRLWVSVGDAANPNTVFNYTPNRSRDGPDEFFKNYKGHLQVDAYSAYEGLFLSGDIIEVACWAHARRKFFDAKTTDDPRSHEMLGMIRGLYAVEDKVAAIEEDAAKASYRQQHAKPLLDAIEKWLKDHKDQVLPKSPMGEAIGYALNNWQALNRYIELGYLSIDNNVAERAMRAIAIGRKNWLFAGSDAGGHTAAVLYSIVATCKRHGIDPWQYLRDALTRLPTLPPDRLSELLPDVWAKAQREQSEAQPV
jgi:transposase